MKTGLAALEESANKGFSSGLAWPETGSFYRTENEVVCGCAIGSAVLANGGIPCGFTTQAEIMFGLKGLNVLGVIDGFDGVETASSRILREPTYLAGREVGRRLRSKWIQTTQETK